MVISKMHTDVNLADMLTKVLSTTKFELRVNLVGTEFMYRP